MNPATLAFAAAALGVAAAWDLLGAAQRARLPALLAPQLSAGWAAGRHGRVPSAPERRRAAIMGAAALAAAGWLVAGWTAGAGLALGGPSASAALVRARRRRHAVRVEQGAAEAARALADAVSAGNAVRGALLTAAASVGGACGHELRRTAAGLAVGEPTEAAIERLRLRAGSPTWDTLCAALLLQRDAGGDLAGLLRRLAFSLEAAARADADARAATAQSRFSAYAVVALPLGGVVVAELGSPGFVAGLLGDPLSVVLVAAALVLQGVALIVVRALARSERR